MAGKEASRKFIGRTEADAPSVSDAPAQRVKPEPYRQGETSRVSGRKGKSRRATGVSKSARRASGAKATGY